MRTAKYLRSNCRTGKVNISTRTCSGIIEVENSHDKEKHFKTMRNERTSFNELETGGTEAYSRAKRDVYGRRTEILF